MHQIASQQVNYRRTTSGLRSTAVRVWTSNGDMASASHTVSQSNILAGVVDNYPLGGAFVVLGGNLGFSAERLAHACGELEPTFRMLSAGLSFS